MSTDGVTIDEATEVTGELVEAWQRLLPQLSKSAPPLSEEDLTQIVQSEAATMFLARLDGKIVGSLTLVIFKIPDGVRAWIESVVVDEGARGRGIGELLSRRAVERALQLDARSIDLTSNPKREAANRLYQRIGFQQRETNVYRYSKG